MYTLARGAAYLDRSGAVLAADEGFVTQLGLSADDPAAGIRARAETEPALRALLSGEGPSTLVVRGADGAQVELQRIAANAGALLLVRCSSDGEWLEHAMRSQGLSRVAAGLAHDIKNPLNAMALQLALLSEKLGEGSATTTHLLALRDQIGRVNEVVRRFLDVTDPSAPLGYTDVGALLSDTVSLFGHEARRRRIEVSVEVPPGAARTSCDPGRTGRLVMGLVSRALAETPDGGRLAARVAGRGREVQMVIEHAAGDPDPEVGYYSGVAAATAGALGGALSISHEGALERVLLRLPRYDRE
jgi:signal transduction histidine kinase